MDEAEDEKPEVGAMVDAMSALLLWMEITKTQIRPKTLRLVTVAVVMAVDLADGAYGGNRE